MKKWVLVALLILALLAGAANAYWFGYQWWLEGRWEAAAERLEAGHPAIDVVCLRYFCGKSWALVIDPLDRTAEVHTDSYTPYVLAGVAMAYNGGEIDAEETAALTNEVLAEAKAIAGQDVRVVFVALIQRSAGAGYVASAYMELYTARPIASLQDAIIVPLWGQPFPDDLVMFPGRAPVPASLE